MTVKTSRTKSANPRSAPRPAPETKSPPREAIRERAYQIFEAHRGEDRSPIDDWLEAERELKHR